MYSQVDMSPRRSRSILVVIVAMLALVCANGAHAQLVAGDVEFWLAPPDVSDLHSAPGGEPLYLILVAGDAQATVTIDQPANGAFVPIVVNVPALGQRRVNLTAFKAQLETRPTNTISNTGLRVVATAPVTAAYEVANTNNNETWGLNGKTALGQEFFIPLHKHAPFNNEASFAAPYQALATFDIVATQNATQVTMFSPTPVDGHPALQQFTVTLNRGQAYSGGWSGANWSVPSTHPSGAIVIADKPIAIAIKDDSIHNPSGGCWDLTGTQLVPVGALGQDYIAIKGSLNSTGDESVFITATQNNTQIRLDGATTPVVTLFAGEYYRVDIDYLATSTNNSVLVQASKPVYASHLTGFGCESALALLPPIDLGGSRMVDITRTTPNSYYIVVLARTSSINAFTVSGTGTATLVPASFLPVPGTNGAWSAARVQYNTTQFPVDSTLRIANSSARFLLGQASGTGASGANYQWNSQFNAPPGFTTTLSPLPTHVPEPGAPVVFTARVENTGVAPAELQSLVDDDVGSLDGIGNCDVPQTIAGGAVYQCAYSAAVTGNAGAVRARRIVASGISREIALVVPGATTVTIDDVLPTIAVVATPSPAVVESGDAVTYTVRIDNTGSAEPVTVNALADDATGSLAGVGTCTLPVVIAPGAFSQCSYSSAVTGPNGTQVTRTITASAVDDEANVAAAQDGATVVIGTFLFADGFEG